MIDGAVNDIGRPIVLDELRGATSSVQDGVATVVEDADRGFGLTVAADSLVSADDGSAYIGSLTLAYLTVDQASVLPPGIIPCGLYALEAKGAVFQQGAELTLPNDDQLLPGTPVDLWVLNRSNFVRAGVGTVTPDGASVTATLTNIDDGAVFAVSPRGATATLDASETSRVLRPNLLGDGALQTAISTPTYRSLDQDRGVSLVYTSSAAAPTITVASTTDVSVLQTRPISVTSRLTLGGVTASEVVTPVGTSSPSRFAQTAVFDARAVGTGRYPGELVTTSRYACSRVETRTEDSFLLSNEAASPFGAGWGVAGLQRLIKSPDGSVAIADGAGNVTSFEKAKEFGAIRESVAFDIKSESVPATGDVDNDGQVDFVAYETTTGNVVYYRNTTGTDFELQQSLNIRSGSSIRPRPSGNGGNVNDLELVDLNGDGLLDLVVADDASWTFILLNDGGSFSVSQRLRSADSEIVLADFNQDGFTDLATADGDDALVFVNDTAGTFGNAAGDVGGSDRFRKAGAYEMAAVDVDLDGNLDFVNVQGNGLYIHWGNGVLDFPETFQKVELGRNIARNLGRRVSYRDTDGDGDVDFGISGDSGRDDVYVQNLGEREFAIVDLPRPVGIPYTDNLFTEDLDGNGLVDVVVDEREPQGRYVYHAQTSPGVFAAPEIVVFGHILGEAKAVDMDGDGIKDIVSKPRFNLFIDFANEGNRKDFLSPVTDFTTLVQNDDGTYTRRYKNGITITFGADGRQTAQTDSNGNVTAYDYDGSGRLQGITDPTGQETVLSYGAGGKLRSVTDPGGRVTTYHHDAVGRLVRVQEPQVRAIPAEEGAGGDAPGPNPDSGAETLFAYDEQGRLITRTDPRGFTVEHVYGPGGAYEKSVLPDGSLIAVQAAKAYGLDSLDGGTGEPVAPEDRVSTITDANGNVTTTEVNEYGAPIRVTDTLGRTTLFERNADNLVTAVVEPSDATAEGTMRTEFGYDALGNMTVMREAVGTAVERETTYSYEETNNRLAVQTDPDGFSERWSHDGSGNPIAYTDQLSDETRAVASYDYNERGQQTVYTDLRGNQTTFLYGTRTENLLRMINAEGEATDYGYDTAGNITRETHGFGTDEATETTRVYLTTNQIRRETDGEGGVTAYDYDPYYNLKSVTDPTGVRTAYAYDERNRLVATNDPVTGRTTYAYDANGNLTTVTDAAGEATTYGYDAVDRMVRSVDALGGERLFAYDVRDNLVSVTDANGNETRFAYDALDRPVSRTNALGETWTFAYDARDNRVATTKPDGSVIESEYDARSDLLAMTGAAPGGRQLDQRYAYDAAGNLLTAAAGGPDGIVRGFEYDAVNRPVASTVAGLFGGGAENARLAYAYDAVGRRVSMADGYGASTAYAYDRRGALVSLTAPSGRAYVMRHDEAGRMEGRTAPNGVATMTTHDGRGRLYQTRHGALNVFDYGHTARGDLSEVTEGMRTRAYGYDALQRLVAVTATDGTDEAYTLDPEGNREASHLSASHVTGKANRLLSTDEWTYAYDRNGNRTERRAKDGSEVWAYEYDVLDRLVEVRKDGAVVEAYGYDALGDRVAIEAADGTRTGVVHDGPDRVLDLVAANDAGSATGAVPVRRYVHGGGVDEPLEVEALSPADGSFQSRYTYHADHLGSVRTLSSEGGEASGRYDYDSYGGLLEASEPGSLGGRGQPFGYTGRERDRATGLYHYRARAYDPETGTFLQEDPIGLAGGDMNLSRYVGSNPIGYSDPSGLIGERAATYGQAQAVAGYAGSIGSGLGCIFGGIASVFDTVSQARAGGGQIVSLGVQDCAATAVVTGATSAALGYGAGKALGPVFASSYNPFFGKSAKQIDRMLMAKGFRRHGKAPTLGKGGYQNTRTGRTYHIDLLHGDGKGPHVSIQPPRGSPARTGENAKNAKPGDPVVDGKKEFYVKVYETRWWRR